MEKNLTAEGSLYPAVQWIITSVFIVACILSAVSCRSKQDEQYSPALQQNPNTAFCRDFTGTLGSDAEGLSRYSEVFLKDHNLDLIVAIIPSCNGKSIENKAAALFSEWNIGKKKGGRGILVLASQQEKALKIEVGYALEHVFTDAFCGYLARNSVNAFGSRDGLASKLNGIVLAFNDRINLHKDRYCDSIVREWERVSFTGDICRGSGGAGATKFADEIVGDTAALLTEHERALFRAGTTPRATLDVLKRSLVSIVKDPHLDIYTDAMKILRTSEGWDFFNNAKYLATLRYGMPVTIEKHGRFAVAKPASSYRLGWPLFLVQGKDGRWRIDEVRLAQNTIVNTEGKMVVSSRCHAGLDYINDPYLFAYGGSEEEVRVQQALSLILEDTDIGGDVTSLKQQIAAAPDEWQYYWQLARIYLQCNAIGLAWEMIGKVLELKTDDADLFEKAGGIYSDYNFMYSKALWCYQKAYSLGSRTKSTLLSLGFLCGYFHRGKEAERYLKELVHRFPGAAESGSVCMEFAIAYHFQNKETLRKEWELKARSHLSAAEMNYFQRIMK